MNVPKFLSDKAILVAARALLSLVFGCLVATVTLYSGLHQANREGSLRQITWRQRSTIHDLSDVRSEIVGILSKTQRLPNLTELSNRHYSDGWGYPIHYSVNGAQFHVMSYGSDGMPGGRGPAADLTPDSKLTADRYQLTMSQFLTLPDTMNMAFVGLGAGMLSALLCFYVTQPPGSERSSGLPVGLRLVLLFANSVFIGTILSALNAPTSH